MKNIKFGILEVIVFSSGAIVMILELIGSRMLAPYLGTSIFIWASLIGVVLGALSLGYYLGGRLSNYRPSLERLAKILLLSGFSILLVALVQKPVLGLSTLLDAKVASIIVTLILFLVPNILMGMVSPYAMRLKINDVKESGQVAGNLYALSTLGSIFGTFLAGFYLIPHFGINQIIYSLGLIMVFLALLNFKKLAAKIFILIATVSSIFFIQTVSNSLLTRRYIFEKDTAYNHITVTQEFDQTQNDYRRTLYLANASNSAIYLNSDELVFDYQKIYLLDNLFKPEIKKALTLGGGAYTGPLNFLVRYPAGEMTVVEIDPEVTQTAKDYFKLKDDPRLLVYHDDARIFLNQNQNLYDVIYGDVFGSYYSIPFQLTTKEAMEKISAALVPDGIFVLNTISALVGVKAQFFQAQLKTLKAVFPQIYIFPTKFYKDENLNQAQNIVIVASKNSKRLTFDELLTHANEEQKSILQYFWDKEITFDQKVKLLTDDFAPVDYYLSKIL